MDYTRAAQVFLVAGWAVTAHGDAADPHRNAPAHHSSRPVAVCRYLPVGRVIVLNGDTADWRGQRFHPIGRAGSFACVWTRLTFVCAIVVDDMHITEGDRVELHFDLEQEHGAFAKERRSTLSLGPIRRRAAWIGAADEAMSRDRRDLADALLDETGVSVKQRTGGYIVEAEVPFYALSDKRFPPQSFGLDVDIIDSAGGADTTKTVASWSASVASDRDDPALWGRVVLRPAMYPVKVLLETLLILFFCIASAGGVLAIVQSVKERRRNAGIPDTDSPRVKSIKNYVAARAARSSLSAAEAAASLGLSTAEMAEVLAEAGTTFEALVNSERLGVTRRLLRESDTPIGEIAAQAGFADEASMRSIFVKVTNTTPEAFRKRSHEEAEE